MTQISFDIGKATDAGRTGKHNEDAYAVFSTRLQTEADSTKADIVQVAVVADGIGGSAAGERASQITVKTIQEVMTQTTVPIRQRLEAAIHESNTRIYQAAQNDPSLKGMGTTMVAAVIVDQLLFVAHAGDSRAYLIRVGVAHQLTKDHTWVQEALEAGYLSPEEATHHPNRNVIKRYLGIRSEVEIDNQLLALMPDRNKPTALTDQLDLQPGDTILLCSDGLTDVVSDQTIAHLITIHPPQKAANKLIDQANKAGGPDNITAVLLHWPAGRSSGRLKLLLIGALILFLLGGGAVLAWLMLLS